ncbi:uncharacterized protein [Oscarella lobularis]|uniref:uncharacterized protein isoform X2 n=1 Tax=Oscarella lobularis TaxID=121494 RepID=UPI003314184F
MSSACPSPRIGHVAAVIDDEMLLWGGVALRETTGEKYACSLNVIECFNLSTSQWNQRRATSNSPSDLPPPSYFARVGVVQNRAIYQFGGIHRLSDGRPVYLNDFHKLNGSTLEWERILPQDQSTPSGRYGHGLCVLGTEGDEHLVMMGGAGPSIVSPIPDGSQFVPDPNSDDLGWNNEVWLFSIRRRNWIPAHCTGQKPSPRQAHSFTAVDDNRAILIGGVSPLEGLCHDAFLFMFSSLEWIKMQTVDHLIHRSSHSTVIANIPTLGPVAFVLWGYGRDGIALSLAQMILIDFQQCKTVPISDEPIPTGKQSVCSILKEGLLFILRYGGTPHKSAKSTPEALLDILKYDLKSIDERLLRHHLSEPIEQEKSQFDENSPLRSNSPTMNCEGTSRNERELLHLVPQRVKDTITVYTNGRILNFTPWKKFSTPVSVDKEAEISIPNTRSTLRIQPRAAVSPKTSIGLSVFTFDAKQSDGVQDDEFVSDFILLSFSSGLSDNDFDIEMCHEHGLNLDPTTPKTSASKVVFSYERCDPSAPAHHSAPIKFDEKIVIDRAGERKISALLQSSVVKVVVAPYAPSFASAVAYSDVTCSFYTHFYGVGRQAFSFHALSFEKVKIPDGWQFDLCLISTRPEHRDRYLAYRNDGRRQPLLLDRRVNNLLLSPTESNVVEVDDIDGWINESRRKSYLINMRQLLAARDSPVNAWVDTFHFACNQPLQELPTMSANVTIISGDRRQCLRIHAEEEALLEPDLLIERNELVYDEDKDFVGGGGYGEVYKATLKKGGIERQVAVKLFYDFRNRRTEKEYEMFKKEASILLRIKANDNVVSLIGLCAVPRHYALVTEFVSGGSLHSLLKSAEHEEIVQKWQSRIAFAKQIAEGMLHLHYNHPSVIHQDLKAHNVLDFLRHAFLFFNTFRWLILVFPK